MCLTYEERCRALGIDRVDIHNRALALEAERWAGREERRPGPAPAQDWRENKSKLARPPGSGKQRR